MNKAFLEDLKKQQEFTVEIDPVEAGAASRYAIQLYIAEKLWSIEQILLRNQEQR